MQERHRRKLVKMAYEIDVLDYKIVRLFEQRMCVVKAQAEFRAQHDMLPKEKKKRQYVQIVEKTTSTACDTEVIPYTEGLIQYILTVAQKFYRKNCQKLRKS